MNVSEEGPVETKIPGGGEGGGVNFSEEGPVGTEIPRGGG